MTQMAGRILVLRPTSLSKFTERYGSHKTSLLSFIIDDITLNGSKILVAILNGA